MCNAGLAGGEHDGDIGVAPVGEVGVLRLVMFFVGSDGPDAEVVDLFSLVVADFAGVAAALGLEDANGLALALDGAALPVNGFEVFVEEDDCGGVAGVVGGVGLGCVESPLGDGLALGEPTGECWMTCDDEQCRSRDTGGAGWRQMRDAHVSFLVRLGYG